MADLQKKERNTRSFVEHLILTFLIIGVLWGVCILLGAFGITVKTSFFVYIPWFLGGVSPAIASYIVLRKNHVVSGFVDWLKHVFDFKHNIWGYLLAIIFPVIQALMMCLLSGFTFGLAFYWLPLILLAMVFAGGLEEAGWRYITYPFLKGKCGFILAALITAVIWWGWHAPLFFIPEVSQFHKNFLVFGIMVLGMSFMLASIREITGSVWLCVLCHAIVNSAGNFFHYDMYGSYLASSITTATLIVLSVAAVLIHRLYLKKKTRNAEERPNVDAFEFPEEIKRIIKDLPHQRINVGRSGDKVYAFDEKYLLKISQDKESLRLEKEKNEWVSQHLGGPKTIKYLEDESQGYYLRSYLRGHTLIEGPYITNPSRLITILKKVVDTLRSLDDKGCPFESTGSEGTDFVHGDLCLPNIVVDEEDNFLGFLDLSDAGRGDKQYDYCWLLWSFEYNLKTNQYNDELIKELGIEINPEDYARYVDAETGS